MPRWHHSDFSSERYQEVKSIKTFYAAHISRSQAKSMFGNWTNLDFCSMNFFLIAPFPNHCLLVIFFTNKIIMKHFDYFS